MPLSPFKMHKNRSPDWLKRWVYAHRGLHSASVPENSIAAAKAALAAGFGIECDVQRSADDQLMVFHDWELDRLTNASGPVARLSAEQLSKLRLLDSAEAPFLLGDLLKLVDGKAPILIEIKSMPGYDVERSCALAESALREYEGPCAVMSFDQRVGGWFAQHAPSIVRGLVGTDTLDQGYLSAWRAKGALEEAKPDFLALDVRDLPDEFARLWRDGGRPLLSWTVRSKELKARAEGEVDALIAESEGIG